MKNWYAVKKMKLARYLLKSVLKDQNFRIAYSANIAMTIYDNRHKDGRLNIHTCNDVAEKILISVFGCQI